MAANSFNPIEQLKRDKHTLLEGYVTEHLFKKQFLAGRTKEKYSHGWWTGMLRGKRFLFILKNNLNNIDKEIINTFKKDYECWQVLYTNEGLRRFINDDYSESLSETDFFEIYKLERKQLPLKATSETSNNQRQNRCIEYFKNHQLLNEIAVERNFADDFLSVFFSSIINIDYFTKNENDELCAIEIKFKNETFDGYFGIDAGPISLLLEIRSKGIKVYHVILYKDRDHKDMSIFDYIEDTTIDKAWYIHNFEKEDIVGYSEAPEKTSVDGKKKQSFGQIRKEVVLNGRRITLRL